MSPALRLSITANVAMACVIVALLWRSQPATPTTQQAPVQQPAARASKAPTVDSTPKPLGTELTPSSIDQLEQMGISREVLVNVVLGEFHRGWDERFAELERKYAPKRVPQWEYVELEREREETQTRELRETLGENRYLAWEKNRTLRLLNPGNVELTAEESDKAYRLQKEFDTKHRELQMAMEDGIADMADARALQRSARDELDKSLKELLGDERFRAIRGISDPTDDVYRKFGDINPTPDQAKAALQIEEDYLSREAALTRQLSENPTEVPAVLAQLEAMEAAREEHLRKLFGADAYEDLQRQNDPTFNKLIQYADAWELENHEAQFVYQTLHDFHNGAELSRKAARIREAAGDSVDWRQVEGAIQQARQHTEAVLQERIGDERLSRLKRNQMLDIR